MKKSNKENLPLTLSTQKQLIFPITKKKSHPQKCQFSKSAQQLMALKNNIANHNQINKNNQQRFSSVLSTSTKHNTIQHMGEQHQNLTSNRYDNRFHNNPLRNSIDSINIMSTIQMLKKHAELLDTQENLGTIQRLSTIQNIQTIPQKNIVLHVNNRIKKNNPRKIAKGRPELYNWVRNYKKQLVQVNIQEYKTQIMRKTSGRKGQKKQTKENKQTINQKDKFKSQFSQNCNKTKRMTFLEKLRKLEQLKQRGKSFQFLNQRRIQSQNCEDILQSRPIKTLI